MSVLTQIENILGKISRGVAALMIMLIAALIIFEIILRSLFGTSTFFTDEYVGYMIATAIIFGLTDSMQKGEHLRIGLLFEAVNPKVRRILEIINVLLSLMAIGTLGYYFLKFVLRQHTLGSLSATITQTPIWIPAAVVTSGLVLFSIQLIIYLIKLVSNHAIIERPSNSDELHFE